MPSTDHPPAVELHDYYTTRYDEAARLGSTLRGRLERTRLREVLSWFLPTPPARVADIGGGPGAHAAWLLSQGYAVELLDPIDHHVEKATDAGIPATIGDARDLPWAEESFDAALLAGPLYHLTEAADRRRALAESARIVRPGGVLAVVAINRYANLIGATLANQLHYRRDVVEDILTDGHSPQNDRMACTYYHTVAELRTDLTAAGLRHITVHGLTGPGGWLTVALDRHAHPGAAPQGVPNDPDPLHTALDGARIADRYPDLLPASALLMAVGHR